MILLPSLIKKRSFNFRSRKERMSFHKKNVISWLRKWILREIIKFEGYIVWFWIRGNKCVKHSIGPFFFFLWLITSSLIPKGQISDKVIQWYYSVFVLQIRVSATMTNAPVVLTLDSNMHSNDPQTPLRALCYLLDPDMDPNLGFVQFPQTFDGINKNDI